MKPALILLSAVACATSVHAQVLRATSSSGEEAVNPEIIIYLEAGDKKAPVAIQFDIRISARHFALERWAYSAAPAALSAGKTVQCAGHWTKAPGTYVYTCIIAGRTSEIPDGPIFRATLVRSNEGKRRSGKITIESAQSVDAEGRRQSIRKTEWAYR